MTKSLFDVPTVNAKLSVLRVIVPVAVVLTAPAPPITLMSEAVVAPAVLVIPMMRSSPSVKTSRDPA